MFRIDITRFLGAAGLIFCVCLGTLVSAATGERVALIIGNSEYTSVPRLKNPKNDAADLADRLSALGFEVQVETDLDQSRLLRTLRGFQRQARGSDIALIYYAGHGIEMAKQNYLIPTDAILETDGDILFEAVPLENAVLAAEGARTLSLVIVDACRNNPFAAQIERTNSTRSIGRGLAKIEPQGNTLIAYAAKDGTVAMDGDGRNSPYAAALMSALDEPQLEVGLMFRKVRDMVLESTGYQQEPYFYGSLSSKELFLNKTERKEDVLFPARPQANGDSKARVDNESQDLDMKVMSLIWDSIRESSDPADFQDFVKDYPASPFTSYARRALDRLVVPEPKVVGTDVAVLDPSDPDLAKKLDVSPASEDVVKRSLTRNELREIQERLTVIKYKPGPIDGLIGKRTKTAISAYQKAKQLEETGEPSLLVLERLRGDVSEDELAVFRVDLAKRRAAWAAAQRKKKAAELAAAALAQQQAQSAAEAKAAAAELAKPKRKRFNLEASDDDRSSGSSSSSGSGDNSSGGGESSSGGGSTCSGIC